MIEELSSILTIALRLSLEKNLGPQTASLQTSRYTVDTFNRQELMLSCLHIHNNRLHQFPVSVLIQTKI